ncbi:M56 family metallopeptidase [Fervidibacillus halotolerans]|uniref:M56 family metallopeptidase n=1 Tax=Fervidibacillus halotolerans TaxID=2980027 RepID=A0A9E8M0A5_9BACI|nr:M56 family metallopeptidase [Fervidibacillus halotolerans]WAA12652.1 M56 family metallopeptidase [Fervidibacillus halotolerans]
MTERFLTVVNMSLTASYVILFVILVRMLLKKSPKFISYALWSVVAFRLIFPFSFESVFSLMPRNTNVSPISNDMIDQQNPLIDSGIEAVDSFVNHSFSSPTNEVSVNPLQNYIEVGSYIWIAGVIALLIYSIISIFALKRQLKDAKLIEKNIYQANNLKTPFVFGFFRPRIYLPIGLNKEEQNYILLHEQIHIRRKDHLIKPFAFFIVSVHWFNPLVWIAFRLMNTDMELSCDEKVLKVMDGNIKKPYATSLLSLATKKHILNGSPLSFGEGDVKRRITNVLNYKKPSFRIILFSIIIVGIVGIGLLANPKTSASLSDSSYHVKEILYQSPSSSLNDSLDTLPQYSIKDQTLYSKQITDENWSKVGELYEYKLSKQKLSTLFNSSSKNVQELINRTKLVFRTDIDEEHGTFDLLLELKNGEVLLASGYDNEEASIIHWLVELEKLDSIHNESNHKDEEDIQALVEDFGKTLQKVSLSAPDHIVAKSIEENYSEYITSELLEKWKNDPQSAAGRMVSSPWPDRIDIIKIENTDETHYTVYGEIIEVTSLEKKNGGVAAKRPITLVVGKENEHWLINDVAVGKYIQ